MSIAAASVTTLLEGLIGATESEVASTVTSLTPRAQDYKRVFRDDAAAVAQRAYTKMWASAPPLPVPVAGSRLVLMEATAAQLADGLGDASAFPGGFSKIVNLLNPDITWFCWRFATPDDRGVLYNGLAWAGDHAAWFPKPWRVLS